MVHPYYTTPTLEIVLLFVALKILGGEGLEYSTRGWDLHFLGEGRGAETLEGTMYDNNEVGKMVIDSNGSLNIILY